MHRYLLQLAVPLGAAGLGAVDRYGDPLPKGALQRLGTLRLRFPGGIGDVCYLPDGRVAIALGPNIEIWDMAKGERQSSHRVAEASLTSVQSRRDGKVLLLGDSAGNLYEWDLQQAKRLRMVATGQRGLCAARYSPDETRVLATYSSPPTLKEWDLATGRLLVTITGKMHSFEEGIYAANGKTAFVDGAAGSEAILAHYDLTTGALLHEWLKDYYAHSRSLVLSEDGQRLLCGSRHRATEWQIEGYKLLKEFTGHHGHAVVSVAYCRDPNQILTGSRDGSIRRWDRLKGEVLAHWFPHSAYVTHIRVSPDGQWVLSYGRGTVAECRVTDGTPRLGWERHEQAVSAVAPLPNGRAASASGDATLRVWDVASGQCLKSIRQIDGGVYALAVSPDGARAAAGCKDGVIREFALEDGRLLRELKGHRGYIRSLVYTTSGAQLFSSADDGSVRIWERDRTEAVRVLEGHVGGVLTIALSPDGRSLLSGGRDGTVRHWDLATGKERRVLEGHRGWVEAVLFAGNVALSGARDCRILKWNLATGQLAGEMKCPAQVLALACTPDGKRVCAGDESGVITLWEVATGKMLGTHTGHLAAATALAIVADRRWLVSASADTTLLVWRL